MSDHEATTYDGLPIAREKPYLACVIVYREAAAGRHILILHRAHNGADYEGDWAWTPPAGARLPGEECAVFTALAPADCAVVLDGEHDRYEWMSVPAALDRCLPAIVAEEIRAAMGAVPSG